VYQNGSSLLLQDGIVRMRWRGGSAQPVPQPMVPGAVYAVSIDLLATSFIFAAGHRIRLAVSSSNYPRFSPNPNNGLPLVAPFAPVPAANTVLWGGASPSALWLPVVPLAALPPFPVFDAVERMADRVLGPELAPHGPAGEPSRVERLDALAMAGSMLRHWQPPATA